MRRPDCIAYELSLSLREGTHLLYLIALSDSGGIGRPTRIELPVQVHGMAALGLRQLLGGILYT